MDDLLIITKGSLNDHEQEIDKVLNLLDIENLAIKLQKVRICKDKLSLDKPLSPLLSKSKFKSQNKLDWKTFHTEAFNKIKEAIKSITENRLFDVN